MIGEHRKRIMGDDKEWAKEQVKREWKKTLETAKPKRIPYGQFVKKYNLYNEKSSQYTAESNPLLQPSLNYAVGMVQHCGKLERLKGSDKNLMRMIGESYKQDLVFHAGKLSWLIEQIDNLYSTVSAVNFKRYGEMCAHVHPGSFRQHAMIVADYMHHNIIVWDTLDQIDAPVMGFHEWWNVYDHPKKDTFFEIYDNRIEAHMAESRPDMYSFIERQYDLFGSEKVSIIGNQSDKLAELDLFREGKNEGLVIETKNDYTLKLDDVCGFFFVTPDNPRYETDNYTIYKV